LRVPYSAPQNRDAVESILRKLNLNTVCAEAACPNYGECFSRKTATFMIMGINCTRSCGFCNVRSDIPTPLDSNEPQNVALAIAELELKYVVVTSVTRDDLTDGGAEFFAKVIKSIRQTSPKTVVEVLIPDFAGSFDALKTVTDAVPDVISHNMETVKSLYSTIRPQADYQRSLNILKNIKLLNPKIRSKSGFMVGFGETSAQVRELLDDLRDVDCEFLTIGQYLSPSKQHVPVQEYINPQTFEEYAQIAKQKGFAHIASAPFVRSSYHADEAFKV